MSTEQKPQVLIPPAKISFVAKLHMISVVLGSIGYFIYGLFFLRNRKGFVLSGASSLFVRNLFKRSSQPQLQWFLPPTNKMYETIARFNKFKPETHVFPDGSMGHWMGSRTAKQTVVYFHGGGYMCPATLAHMQWLWDIHHDLTKSGTETSVLILTYQLAPHRQYPYQLQQAVNLLRHAIEIEGLAPSQIIIGGDSAGGNLTLAVLSHLMHPHPAVPELKLSAPFRGALLISPWIKFDYELPVPKQYRWDMLSGPALAEASRTFIGDNPRDNYNEPVNAPASWWASLPQYTKAVYVWCGGDEMLRPSIEKISDAMALSIPLTKNVVAGATHVSTIVDVIMPGTKGIDPAILDWIKAQGEQPSPEKIV